MFFFKFQEAKQILHFSISWLRKSMYELLDYYHEFKI